LQRDLTKYVLIVDDVPTLRRTTPRRA